MVQNMYATVVTHNTYKGISEINGKDEMMKNGQFKNQKRYAMNVSFVHQITNQSRNSETPFKWIECDGVS